MFSEKVIKTLTDGGIGVIPTDTIYGVVGRAELPETVERLYKVRKRNPLKPCIILISTFEELEKFGVTLTPEIRSQLEKLWPGKVSIVFPVPDANQEYLTRDTGSLAFRIPDDPELQALLRQSGPLIAPSANFEGAPSAKTITDARAYFGDQVDFYVDAGTRTSPASTIVTFENDQIRVLREGAVAILENEA